MRDKAYECESCQGRITRQELATVPNSTLPYQIVWEAMPFPVAFGTARERYDVWNWP